MLLMAVTSAGSSPDLSAGLTKIEHWLWTHPSIALPIASTAIAICSLVVATSALRVQRGNLRLAQQIASRAGRLQSVSAITELVKGRYRRGYKVINGSDAITVSNVTLKAQYLLARLDGAGILNDRKLTFWLTYSSFKSLGIAGPDLPLRLDPYHEESWLLPQSALQLPRTVDCGQVTYAQCILLQFEVEAAGQTSSSNDIQIGVRHGALLGFKHNDNWADYALSEVLEETKVTYGDGHSWIGLNRWLNSLVEEASHEELKPDK